MKTRTRGRTAERVCLRCDWGGATSGASCPECGAGLWSPRRAAQPKPLSSLARARARMAARADRRAQIASGVTAAAPTRPPSDDTGLAAPDRGARRRGWLSVAVVLIVATVAIVVVRSGMPSRGPQASTSIVGGRLLYVAPDPATRDPRLWVWNLETGAVEPGPRVESPVSLSDASGAGEGSVAVIAETPDGELAAQLLRHLEDTDVAVTVLEGRFVAWGSEGLAAVAASVATSSGPCDVVDVQVFTSATIQAQTLWSGPVCGEVTGIYRTTSTTPMAVEERDDDGQIEPWVVIVSTDDGLTHILPGLRPLGVTGSGDLFAVGGEPGTEAVLKGSAFPGSRPLTYRDDDGRPLLAERYLGITQAGDGAFILGSVGGVRGIYRVPGAGQASFQQITPELVLATDAQDVFVTETSREVPIISVDGRYVVVGDNGEAALDLPDGAPEPSGGPILWIAREGDGS